MFTLVGSYVKNYTVLVGYGTQLVQYNLVLIGIWVPEKKTFYLLTLTDFGQSITNQLTTGMVKNVFSLC